MSYCRYVCCYWITEEFSLLNASDVLCLFVFGATTPQWATASSFLRFLDHTQRRITAGSTPLEVWSARHRDLYLTTHTVTTEKLPCPPAPVVGFEPTISAGEWPQTYALDRAATGTGQTLYVAHRILCINYSHLQFFPHIFNVPTADLIFKSNTRRPTYMS